MKKFKIGDYAYPVDNSCSYTIGEENIKVKYRLAGTIHTPAERVLIVSKPFKMKVDGFMYKLEFRTVFYDGKCHVYLNNFRK